MKSKRLFRLLMVGLLPMTLWAQNPTDTTGTSGALKHALARIQNALTSANPIMVLEDLPAKEAFAQQIALQHPFFKQNLIDSASKKPYRNEIFGVYAARPSDFRNQQIADGCQANNCFRVEMYNYPKNLTTVGLVNVNNGTMVDGYLINQTQPNIPAFLKQVALEIAVQSPEVEAALGFKPSLNQALMSDTKTALNRTRCERSKHLCVAPTFVKEDRALWAVVDLTDMRLVGVRWTNVGPQGAEQTVTERRYQNEEITERFCTVPLAMERDGWKFEYIITSSDGLQISKATYQNKPVFDSAKLVDWHVSYSEPEGFGYSDAIGCPYFSTAAVIAIEPPHIDDVVVNGQKTGFFVQQDFFSEGWPQACNYKYQQRFEFFADGKFRVAAANLGRGCGNNGTYRPVTRIALPNKPQTFYEWQGSNWLSWKTEKWQLQKPTTKYTREGYQYKVQDASGSGYYVMPELGLPEAEKRNIDNAYVFVTRHNPKLDEGDSDLVTIGPCCNANFEQGPEKFMLPRAEPIVKVPLVMWYVPQIKNDDTPGREYCWAESFINDKGVYDTRTWPCYSGPMFVPIQKP